MNVISVENLSFKYRRASDYALKNVTFNVERGEFLGIIGPSGSGKSTLCLALNGIIPNSIKGEFTGRVVVRDSEGREFDTRKTPVSQLSPLVGLVLQNPDSQLFNMTVEEEVAFGLENLALDPNEIGRRVRWALEISGLWGLENESPPNLSGGEKQRLAIAAVFAMRPQVLVLDEPTSQLDPLGREEVLGLLSLLRREYGITIVLVEHHTDYILRHADRVLVMDAGRVIFEGTPAEVAEETELLKSLGVKIPASLEISYELRKRGKLKKLLITPEELLSELRSSGG